MDERRSAVAATARPPSPEAWREAWSAISSRSAKTTLPVSISRVYQLDAERLDVEMAGMLREQLLKVLAFTQPGFLSRCQPELNAFLEFLIWRFSVWVDQPTPGIALLNLRFRDEREFDKLLAAGKVRTGLEGPGLTTVQKILHLLAMVGGRYFWARIQMVSAFQRWGDATGSSWPRLAWTMLQRAETMYRISYFFNLLAFLRTGKYRNIIEALLRIRLVYQRPNSSRAVSFEYMNRQLVWHEFSELLLLVLPLLNLMSLKKVLSFGSNPSQGPKEDACPICDACPITLPFEAVPCGHRHCYFCLSTRCASNAAYRCQRCNSLVAAVKRHHPRLDMASEERVKGKEKAS